MKILCENKADIGETLEMLRHFLETTYVDYPLLETDLIFELSLCGKDGQSCPDNDKIIRLKEHELQASFHAIHNYYNTDALTSLYNRTKYEHDLRILQSNYIQKFACIYIDAVGLHELNNHLGHAAGDHLLCSIAENIRCFFPYGTAYRIGGDEFVIFFFDCDENALNQSIAELRTALHKNDYEISAGTAVKTEELSISETINHAENAMRQDKAFFYEHDGKKRQMRVLNHKLEKLLLEKQDANQFLNVIASDYKGVYMVNPQKDTCRYIYIPEYFKKILENNNGIYSQSILSYCNIFVSEKDQMRFREILDYDYVIRQLRQGNQILLPYEKKDGTTVRLQITIYDHNNTNTTEMLWIFMDGADTPITT